MNRFLFAGVAALVCGGFGTLARGQDSVLAEVYGQGVHTYFSGNLSAAHELFTSAIEQGSKDPRCYYFRGLTSHRLGRSIEGDEDLKMGATLEARTADRIYPVSDSLQRVQGRMRMQIEKQRQQARLAMRLKQNQAEHARFEQLERSSPNANRNQNRAAAPSADASAMPAGPDKSDPFASGADVKPEKAPEKPATVAVEPTAEASDPFEAVTPMTPGATAPPAAEKPAAAPSDPFATPPAAEPAKDQSTDPFSDDKPAEAPPPAETPAEKPAEKPGDDPFGT